MIPTVVYCRYSTGRNQKELSIEGQLRECMDYCQNNNYEVMNTYIDRAVTGRSESREEFQRMLADARRGLFQIVVVYKYNRFFRNRDEAALCRHELRKHGVKLLAVRDPIPEGRGGIYYEAFLDADAEAYSLGLSEDTARGMLDAAKKMLVTGPLPLGYKAVPISSDPKERSKRIEIDPAGAAIVRRIFEMYADGTSIPAICAALNNEGLRTKSGRQFQTTSVVAILENVKYMGIYKYKDEITVEGGCPAIVSADLFADVASMRKCRPRASSVSDNAVEYFLTTKLFCGKCEKPMFGDSGQGTHGRYYYYSCSGRRKQKNCDKQSVSKDTLEYAVFEGALNTLTEENIAIIAAEAEQAAKAESENAKIINQLKSELQGIEQELDNIKKAIVAGIITETTKDMLEDAEARRRDLRGRIVHEEAIAQRVVTSHAIASWLRSFKTGDRDNIDFKRSVFDLLVHKVYLYDSEDGEGEYAIVWCNVAKGKKFKIDLANYRSDKLQLGEPKWTYPNTLSYYRMCSDTSFRCTGFRACAFGFI